MLIRREGVVRVSRAGKLNGCSQGVIQSLSQFPWGEAGQRVMAPWRDESRASLIKGHSHQGSHVVAGMRESSEIKVLLSVECYSPSSLHPHYH